MPLVHIHLIRDVRSPTEMRKVADIIQEVMLDKFNAPPRDRYQVCTSIACSMRMLSASHLAITARLGVKNKWRSHDLLAMRFPKPRRRRARK